MSLTINDYDATYRHFLDAIQREDYDDAAQHTSLSFMVAMSGTGWLVCFREFEAELVRRRNACSDLSYTITGVELSDMDTALIVHATVQGTFDGILVSRDTGEVLLQPTGKPVSFTVRDMVTFNASGEVVSIVSAHQGAKPFEQLLADA